MKFPPWCLNIQNSHNNHVFEHQFTRQPFYNRENSGSVWPWTTFTWSQNWPFRQYFYTLTLFFYIIWQVKGQFCVDVPFKRVETLVHVPNLRCTIALVFRVNFVNLDTNLKEITLWDTAEQVSIASLCIFKHKINHFWPKKLPQNSTDHANQIVCRSSFTMFTLCHRSNGRLTLWW